MVRTKKPIQTEVKKPDLIQIQVYYFYIYNNFNQKGVMGEEVVMEEKVAVEKKVMKEIQDMRRKI